MLERGDGVSVNAARAADLYLKACDLKDRDGCHRLALLYREGNGVARDQARAQRMFREGCAFGFSDESTAASCRAACDGGDAPACLRLARRLETADGVSPNPQLASELYRTAVRLNESACSRGEGPACRALGTLHREGRVVQRDDPRALQYFEKGCEGGSPEACQDAAGVYDWGRDFLVNGQPASIVDHARAVIFYERACAGGQDSSCARAGYMHLEGQGIPRDERRGKELLQRAAELRKKK